MTHPRDSARTAPLWSRPELRDVCGDTLRPSGLELTDRAARLAGLAPGWPVLDAGAGLGATVDHLRRVHGARAVGLERSVRQLELAPEPAPLVRGDAQSPPFADCAFRMVFCECVFSLLPDKPRALSEWFRVLAPGGWLALSDLYLRTTDGGCATARRTVADCGCATTPHDCAAATPGSCADGALPQAEIVEMLGRAGFAVRRFEDHTRRLKELAARLILSGVSTGCRQRAGTGYFLLIAQRTEDVRCSTTTVCA